MKHCSTFHNGKLILELQMHAYNTVLCNYYVTIKKNYYVTICTRLINNLIIYFEIYTYNNEQA